MQSSALQILVFGKVQGVGYRRFVQKRARQFGLRGWVRNLVDGSVEIYLLPGPHDAVVEFKKYVEGGPGSGLVSHITEQQLTPKMSEELEQVLNSHSDSFLVLQDG